MTPIPFNRPSMAGKEQTYILEAIQNGQFSGDGPFTRRVQNYIESALEVRRALLTTSCTHALELAALLLDIQPGDEVVVPSFTFVSTVNAFVLRGARPVFVDIRPDTLNLDETKLEAAITPRTKAIVAVHYAGVPCEMDSILATGARHGVAVIEDTAHGLFGRYRDRWLGSLGCLATLSFHETKNFTCGEGGALLINDPEFAGRAEILREKGTNRTRFLRGEIDKYTWIDVGSSYLPADILAAILWAQLERRDEIQSGRQQIWTRYYRELTPWAEQNSVRLPTVPDYCEQPCHLFYVLMPSEESRDGLMDHLRRRAIQSTFHYLPLHLSEMGRRTGRIARALPVCESVSKRLLRLPFYRGLTAEEQARIVDAVCEFETAVPVQAQHA